MSRRAQWRSSGGFVLAYVLAVLALGLPLAIAELAIGRRARSDPVSAFGPSRVATI
jgi:SNF family Na+-dependent transporter